MRIFLILDAWVYFSKKKYRFKLFLKYLYTCVKKFVLKNHLTVSFSPRYRDENRDAVIHIQLLRYN